MDGKAYTVNGIGFTFHECGTCGTFYATTTKFDAEQQRMGPKGGWRCPNGHSWSYTRPTEQINADRQELQRLRQRIAQRDDEAREAKEAAEYERRRANGYKGAATRMKNRAKAGVCPCCNRHFTDLQRHMASKHSDADLTNVVEFGQTA